MRSIIALVLTLFSAGVALATDAYPNKAIRFIVSFGAGGSSDASARVLATQLSQQLNQPVVVENRPGAGGVIGNQLAVSAPPDGYTILLVDVSFTTLPGLRKSMPYDVIKDFTPITQFSTTPNAIVLVPSFNIRNMADLLAYAKANPKKILYGSSGIGTPGHLSGELLRAAAMVDITHIPYKSGGEQMAAVLGGHVQMLLAPLPVLLSNIKSGQLTPLMLTTNRNRSPILPDVPTATEAGLPEVNVETWFGVVGPRGMPPEIVNKLREEIVKAINVPAVKEKFAALGSDTIGNTPKEFGDFMQSEVQRWTKIIDVAGIPKID